jgi:hypothetical protein
VHARDERGTALGAGLTFSEGSQGIFTTAVPEPGTIVLASAAGIVMAAIGLRRRGRETAPSADRGAENN